MVRTGDVRIGQVSTGQVRTCQVRTGQVRIGRSGQVKSEQIRLGHVKSSQDWSSRVRTGQDNLEHVKSRLCLDRLSRVWMGQVKLGKSGGTGKVGYFLDIKFLGGSKTF